MTVTWVNVEVPLVGGVATKDDPFVMQGRMLDLQNIVLTKRGQYAKRNGYRRLGQPAEAPAQRSLFTRDRELVGHDGSVLRTYSPQTDTWKAAGDMSACAVDHRPIAKVKGEQSLADWATAGGLAVVAWEDSRGTVRFSVYDEQTGAVLAADQSVPLSRLPRCVAVEGVVHLVYYHTTAKELRAQVVRPADLQQSLLDPPLTLADDVRSTIGQPLYSIGPFGASTTQYVLAYATNTAADRYKVKVLNRSAVSSLTITRAKVGGGADPDTTTIDACGLDDGRILVIHSFTGATDVHEYSSVGVQTVSQTRSATAALRVTCSPCDATAVTNDGGATSTLTGTRSAWIWYELPGSVTRYNYVTAQHWVTGLGSGLPVMRVGNSVVATRAFRRGGDSHCALASVSTLQTTYYAVRARCRDDQAASQVPFYQARFLPGTAGGVPRALVVPGEVAHLPQWELQADGTWRAALVYRTRLDSLPSTTDQFPVYAERGVALATLDFAHEPRAAESGRTAYLTGGLVWQYDGRRPVEANFFQFVEGASAVQGGAGAMAAGTYTYLAIPSWVNDQGLRERGTCSAAFTATIAASKKVVLTVPVVMHTMRRGLRSQMALEIYRREVNSLESAPYRRVSSLDPTTSGADNGYLSNSTEPTGPELTWTDNMTDAALLAQELLYLNGGVLQNFCPEGATVIATAHDRLLLAGTAGDPARVQVSKLHFEGEGVAWNQSLDVRLEDRSGAVTALSQLNETIVLATATELYRVDGDGPNDLGQGLYPPPRIVASDVGVTTADSVCATSQGMVFKSAKGIYLLAQSMVPTYIGADVERYNAQGVTAATLCPSVNQVRLLTSSGRVLVWDYLFNQWTTFSSHEGGAACLWQGQYAYARTAGAVGAEQAGLYSDFGSGFTWAVETAWLKPSGLQGFQRVRDATFLGRYVSPHRIRVSYQFNYEDGLPYVHEWDSATQLNLSTYGSSSTYGSESPYGGSGSGLYQFQVYLAQQKCESVRFRVEDVLTGAPGASAELTEIVLSVGGLGGIFRQGRTAARSTT